MKKLLYALLLFLLTFTVSAQEEDEKDEKIRRIAIGAGAGTGYNVDVSARLTNLLAVTARYGTFQLSTEDDLIQGFAEGATQDFGGQEFVLDGDLDFKHVDLVLSFGGSLRLMAGAGYFMSNQLNLDLSFVESITINDLVIEAEDQGTLNIGASWAEILPFVGVGFGRVVPKTGFNIGLELGAYYDSQGPQVDIEGTGLLVANGSEDQLEILEESFKDNKFLPYLNLRMAFSF